MAWKGTGIERMRRFEAYRALEARVKELEAELASKEATIKTLARELAGVAGYIPPPTESTRLASNPAFEAPLPSQATLPHPGIQKAVRRHPESPGPKEREQSPVRVTAPLSKVLGEK